MPSASLKFTQASPGPGAGGAGYALMGVAGTAVTAANVDNSDVVNAQFELLYVPPGSGLTTGIKQAYSTANPVVLTSSWTFTPDVPGGFVVRLRGKNAQGAEAVDDRVFGVPEDSGRFIPPFASGRALNFLGQLLGWLPNLRDYLTSHDQLEQRTSREYLGATTDNAAHTLSTFALPTNTITLVEATILGIKADGTVAKWWQVKRAFHHNGTGYTAGTLTTVASEAINGTPTWTVDLNLTGSNALVAVNSQNDSVKWYVSRKIVKLAKT